MPVLTPFDVARLLPRGLLGYLDDQSKLGGLLGMLDADDRRLGSASSSLLPDERGDGMTERYRRQDLLMQELIALSANPTVLFGSLRRGGADVLSRAPTNSIGGRPLTYDPMTGTFVDGDLARASRGPHKTCRCRKE
jgi:hypothetical protein